MKLARFVLKIIAASLALAALVCCVIAYWDKLMELFFCAKEKVCAKTKCCCPSEYDDYADWDAE